MGEESAGKRDPRVLNRSGQVESEHMGRETTALPHGGGEKSAISSGGGGQAGKKGWLSAALQSTSGSIVWHRKNPSETTHSP